MAGVRWVAERRVLRRASHQSLKVPVFREQSFDTLSQNTPAAAYARGDWDADYRRDDQDESRVAADAEGTAGPTAVREMSRPASTSMKDDSRLGDVAPQSNTLSFKPASRPWYGSQRRLVLALVGAAVTATVVCGVLLVIRSSSGSNEESTTVTPTATTNSVPRPAPPPGVISQPALPPGEIPPPPPPPPEAETAPPPANTGNYPRRPASQPDATPTGRPQTPVQISVTPQVKPTTEVGHSAPGDAPKRRRGFFG